MTLTNFYHLHNFINLEFILMLMNKFSISFISNQFKISSTHQSELAVLSQENKIIVASDSFLYVGKKQYN